LGNQFEKNEIGGACSTYGRRIRIYRDLERKSEGKRLLGRQRLGGGIILRWILRKWDVGAWTGLIWLRIGTGGGNL